MDDAASGCSPCACGIQEACGRIQLPELVVPGLIVLAVLVVAITIALLITFRRGNRAGKQLAAISIPLVAALAIGFGVYVAVRIDMGPNSIEQNVPACGDTYCEY